SAKGTASACSKGRTMISIALSGGSSQAGIIDRSGTSGSANWVSEARGDIKCNYMFTLLLMMLLCYFSLYTCFLCN
ncbi:hypothetical protein, partial [Erwinia persicina]